MRKDVRRLSSDLDCSEEKIKIQQVSLKRSSSQISRLKTKCAKIESQASDNSSDCDKCENTHNELNKLREENIQLREVNALLVSKINELQHETINLYDDNGQVKPQVTKCVWEILSHNVAQGKVVPVIEASLRMAGKSCMRFPSESTIRNMDKQRLLVAQKQLCEIEDRQNTNLQTDETPKFGEKYCAYILQDENANSYLLGMRHMADKSAQTTLDTLKEILSDLTDVCNNSQSESKAPGQIILTNITSTMSDRAATEVKFNNLLEEYRKEFLPLYKDGFNDLSAEEQAVVSKLHNFFCGLHLLVGMADTVCEAFSAHEKLQVASEDDPAGFADSERTSGESGVVRLVRTACKAVSRGGDEKSGIYRHWRVYLEQNQLSKYSPLITSFKGNRFNIVFLLGGNVFFLADYITNCIQNIKTPNKLLKCVLKDIENEYHLAGCRALGLLQKLITSPLWRVTESKGHILDMNHTYKDLVDFFDKCAQDEDALLDFIHGTSPFSEHLVEHDEVLEKLAKPSELDVQCAKLLQPVMLALKTYLEKAVKENLPGGQYWETDDNVKSVTQAAPRHNKAPERVFGILDYLVHHRPNASTIVNEAYLMYCYNKTSDWVAQLSPEELNKLVSDVRKGRKELEAKFKSREAAITKLHLERQQDAARAVEESRKRKFERKKELTEVIIDAGLWQNATDVEEKLQQCSSDAERFRALCKQIRFRQEVLQQDPQGRKDVFVTSRKDSTSGKSKNKHWTEVKDNLMFLIDSAAAVSSSQTVSRCAQEKRSIPLLCGKKIRHKFESVEGGEEQICIGTVISQVPGFPAWYNVIYEDDDAVYSYRLIDDYKEGNIEIVIGN